MKTHKNQRRRYFFMITRISDNGKNQFRIEAIFFEAYVRVWRIEQVKSRVGFQDNQDGRTQNEIKEGGNLFGEAQYFGSETLKMRPSAE